jgi:hypothetical protein
MRAINGILLGRPLPLTVATVNSVQTLKAWLRRATALVVLGKLEEAMSDFKQVLKLEPSNKPAKLELKTLPARIEEQKLKARKAFRPLEHIGTVSVSIKLFVLVL